MITVGPADELEVPSHSCRGQPCASERPCVFGQLLGRDRKHSGASNEPTGVETGGVTHTKEKNVRVQHPGVGAQWNGGNHVDPGRIGLEEEGVDPTYLLQKRGGLRVSRKSDVEMRLEPVCWGNGGRNHSCRCELTEPSDFPTREGIGLNVRDSGNVDCSKD
jgi:hypothetical protein